jgi:hypothetical protein
LAGYYVVQLVENRLNRPKRFNMKQSINFNLRSFLKGSKAVENYRSNLTNRLYSIDVRILPYVDPDTGIKSDLYVMIQGCINGKSELLDLPVSRERIAEACHNMIRSLESFLDGSHNITHYHDFPEFSQLKEIK